MMMMMISIRRKALCYARIVMSASCLVGIKEKMMMRLGGEKLRRSSRVPGRPELEDESGDESRRIQLIGRG
jgi:hypothetical protein